MAKSVWVESTQLSVAKIEVGFSCTVSVADLTGGGGTDVVGKRVTISCGPVDTTFDIKDGSGSVTPGKDGDDCRVTLDKTVDGQTTVSIKCGTEDAKDFIVKDGDKGDGCTVATSPYTSTDLFRIHRIPVFR